MTEREYEVSFKVKSHHPWKTVPAPRSDSSALEIHALNGTWYRVPEDAQITEVTPLRAGYYIMRKDEHAYRVLVEPEQIQYWNGHQWLDSLVHNNPTMKQEFLREADFLCPLDMNNLER
jgi:hypothetical protein